VTTLYVDSSALLKRVVGEPEAPAVRALLRRANDAGDLLTSSSLAWLEMWRSFRRLGLANVQSTVNRATAGIAEFPLDDATLRRARRIGGDELRSLDAIHLAAAIGVGADTVVTYDARMARSAEALGLLVQAPG